MFVDLVPIGLGDWSLVLCLVRVASVGVFVGGGPWT